MLQVSTVYACWCSAGSEVLFKNNFTTESHNGVLIAYSGEPVWLRNGVEPAYEKELILRIENEVITDHEVVKHGSAF